MRVKNKHGGCTQITGPMGHRLRSLVLLMIALGILFSSVHVTKAFDKRVARKTSCITLVSPVSTAVMSLNPDLKWINLCGGSVFVLRLSINSNVIFEKEFHRNSYMTSYMSTVEVPEGMLIPGKIYNWSIDAGGVGIASGSFATLNESVKKRVIEKLDGISNQEDSLETREALIDLLFIYNLKDAARQEIDRFQNDLVAGMFRKGQ